jgi:hypothetical protein
MSPYVYNLCMGNCMGYRYPLDFGVRSDLEQELALPYTTLTYPDSQCIVFVRSLGQAREEWNRGHQVVYGGEDWASSVPSKQLKVVMMP